MDNISDADGMSIFQRKVAFAACVALLVLGFPVLADPAGEYRTWLKQQEEEDEARERARAFAAELLRKSERAEAERAKSLSTLTPEEIEQGRSFYRREVVTHISKSWRYPQGLTPDLSVEIALTILPSGEVIDSEVTAGSGNETFDRSVERAIYEASPMPIPPIPTLYERRAVFLLSPGALGYIWLPSDEVMAKAMERFRAAWLRDLKLHTAKWWLRPPSLSESLSSHYEIELLPNGSVMSVAITKSSGSPSFDHSVENAVYKASPMPLPQHPRAFETPLRLSFNAGSLSDMRASLAK